MVDDSPTKNRQRLTRQLNAVSRKVPVLGSFLRGLLKRDRWMIRLPFALFFILGGLLAVLPVFALWMLPVGLCLLAIDLPPLRPVIVRAVIVGRRWAQVKLRHWWPKR